MHFRRERKSAFPTRMGTPFPQATCVSPMCISCLGCVVRIKNIFRIIRGIIVDFRINEALQTGGVVNSAYPTWGAKVFICFLNSP